MTSWSGTISTDKIQRGIYIYFDGSRICDVEGCQIVSDDPGTLLL